MDKDFTLLEKELAVNDQRIKKLEEHKKLVQPELDNPKSEDGNQRLLETMRRIEKNLKLEYKKRDGIINAINAKTKS
jgi:hypothetical protein